MKLPVHYIQATLAKPFMPVVFFCAGVTYDTLALTRIDRLFDNLFLLLYVSLLGLLIILTGRAQMGAIPPPVLTQRWSLVNLVHRAQPYYVMALQFLFGGLFSAYAIVYSQSASLDTSALFLGVIVLMLVANEFLRNRLARFKLLVTLYALVTFSFFTFFLPVLTGWMNTPVFLVGAIVSAAVVIRVVQITYHGVPLPHRWTPFMASLPAVGLIAVFVGFYFLNWIPPVPLSLKFGGVYHNVTKAANAFELTYGKGAWYEFWKRSDDPFRGEGPVYAFTAVFAPVNLDITVYHHWQYRSVLSDPNAHPGPFSTTDRIPISISGGREEGYRSYTVKQRILPGEWRVNVETEEGQLIGRIEFSGEHALENHLETTTITY